MDFKTGFSRVRNQAQQIRNEFAQFWVKLIQDTPVEIVVENEAEAFFYIHEAVNIYFAETILPKVNANVKEFIELMAKLSGGKYKQKFAMPISWVKLIEREANNSLRYELELFNIKMERLSVAKKSVDILTADWLASIPIQKEKRTKDRVKLVIYYGAGKFYVPILKGLYKPYDVGINNISTLMTTEMSKDII